MTGITIRSDPSVRVFSNQKVAECERLIVGTVGQEWGRAADVGGEFDNWARPHLFSLPPLAKYHALSFRVQCNHKNAVQIDPRAFGVAVE